MARILFPEYTVPDSVPLRMILLFIGAQIWGICLKLLNLPEMLGMISFGIFFTNMGWDNFEGYGELETFLRYLRK